ncbi:MAG TPA: CopG family antitoxin [Phycisphaerae bacterium]|jgi:hypothetical protein
MRKRIPKFRSTQEEAEFWDTHDSTDYLHELEDANDVIFVPPDFLFVELNKSLWRELVHEAKRRRTTPTRLARRWLKEKLKTARRRLDL